MRSSGLPDLAARTACGCSALWLAMEANENSDLDLLVAWEPGRSLRDHAGLIQDLENLLVKDDRLHAPDLSGLYLTHFQPSWCMI